VIFIWQGMNNEKTKNYQAIVPNQITLKCAIYMSKVIPKSQIVMILCTMMNGKKSKSHIQINSDWIMSSRENKKTRKEARCTFRIRCLTKPNSGAHIYFCDLNGMMPGIQDMLKEVATSKGLDYEEWLRGLKSKKQWHVEVY
jgi:hypothetical protein